MDSRLADLIHFRSRASQARGRSNHTKGKYKRRGGHDDAVPVAVADLDQCTNIHLPETECRADHFYPA